MIIVQTKQVIIMTLFKHTKIEEAEDFAHGRLLNAFETSHKRHLVDSNDEDLVSADDGAGLSAVCHSARLCWARFLSRELACRFHYDVKTGAINGKVYFFTLVDVGCRRSVDEFEMDLKPIIRKLRSGIRDRSFIGVIEPGLYSHVSAADGMAPGECISWHLHVLLWGISRKRAKRLAAELNGSGKYVPLSPRQDGVSQRIVREGELSKALGYILKPPKCAYRLGLRSESIGSTEPSFIQYRTELAPQIRTVA
ncbi:hypothetical protein ACVMFA_007380 [Bradyrhizobium liaoningense]